MKSIHPLAGWEEAVVVGRSPRTRYSPDRSGPRSSALPRRCTAWDVAGEGQVLAIELGIAGPGDVKGERLRPLPGGGTGDQPAAAGHESPAGGGVAVP